LDFEQSIGIDIAFEISIAILLVRIANNLADMSALRNVRVDKSTVR